MHTSRSTMDRGSQGSPRNEAMHASDDNKILPAAENLARQHTCRRSASPNCTGSHVPHASPPSPTSSGGCRPVVMDDGTVVDTRVTASGDDVVSFLREVQKSLLREVRDPEHQAGLKVREVEDHSGHIVGLDTEWRINDQPGEPRHRVAVLQLCVGNQCLVFQIHHADFVPDELKDFLANPEFCFAGVGIGNDAKRLREDCNLQVTNTMDLPRVAADVLFPPTENRGDGQHDGPPAWTDLLGNPSSAKTDLQQVKPFTKKDLQQAGLKTLARVVMGMCIEKPKDVTRSNWAARPLSTEQVRYACIDAFVSYDVGRRLSLKKHAQLTATSNS